MPAIQPELLKRQTAQITEKYDQPEKFVRALHNHLDWYSDRTRRPGLNSPPPPIMGTYRVPDQVIRELRRQLKPHAQADPPGSLALADALWEEDNLECRNLAIDLLSWAPAEPYEPLEQRLVQWADPLEEADVLARLFTLGVTRYRRETPDRFMRLAKGWLTSNDPATQALGLQLLTGMVNDPEFTNLPVIYMRV
ncbi:MAG: DNA alkylation repair protein, partial [Anaerolineales bacterium]|nr:DNA alkylation repair protein [Anaerolineales bacterium]